MSKRDLRRTRRGKRRGASTQGGARPRILPSPNAATNLLIVDIVVRGASTLLRRDIEKRVARASVEDEEEVSALVDGRGLIRTLGLYGASRLATRSPAGLGAVVAGLTVKTLYDRGKARQQRLARTNRMKARELPAPGSGDGQDGS